MPRRLLHFCSTDLLQKYHVDKGCIGASKTRILFLSAFFLVLFFPTMLDSGYMFVMPMWRNGRRGRLKIYFRQLSAGSSPVVGNSPDKLSSKRICPVFSFCNPLFFCKISASAGFSGVKFFN